VPEFLDKTSFFDKYFSSFMISGLPAFRILFGLTWFEKAIKLFILYSPKPNYYGQ